MKLQAFCITFLLLGASCAVAAELDDIQAQIAARRLRTQASQNLPLSRPQLLDLCRDLNGRRWCEGYISAILTVYQIPRECLPMTDMALFMNGQVWELTTTWIMQQPQDSKMSLYEAVTGALEQENRCPMGNMLPFDGPELEPFSVAERAEIRRALDLFPLNDVIPAYPPAAQRDGIEGWTQVRFTVTETGTVRDIVLVDADPPEIFNEVSIDAAAELKFTPRTRNGAAIEIPNVQHVFRFNLESLGSRTTPFSQ